MNLQSCMIFVLSIFLPFGRAQAGGTAYQVEPGSKRNTITLEVTNRLSTTLTDLSISVLKRPQWMRVSTADVANVLPVDSIGRVVLTFDVLTGATRSDECDISIVLLSGSRAVLQKTISMMVVAPTTYNLTQNYPNPFNPSTTIEYQLPADGFVTLKVYDLLGREVATLVKEEQKADYYKVSFDRNSLASGVYFYRLQTGDFVATKRLMLLK